MTSTGRHAAPDRVGITLSVLWTIGAGTLLALLGMESAHPCPCDTAAQLSIPAASAPDLPLDT